MLIMSLVMVLLLKLLCDFSWEDEKRHLLTTNRSLATDQRHDSTQDSTQVQLGKWTSLIRLGVESCHYREHGGHKNPTQYGL